MSWAITSCSKCCCRDCCWSGVGVWHWHKWRIVCQLFLSHCSPSASCGRRASRAEVQDGGSHHLGLHGGCLDPDASNMFQINTVLHPALTSSPATWIGQGHTHYHSSLFWAGTEFTQIVNTHFRRYRFSGYINTPKEKMLSLDYDMKIE